MATSPSFHGVFVDFDAIRGNPKPAQGRRIPIVVGGNSDAGLHRVAAFVPEIGSAATSLKPYPRHISSASPPAYELASPAD